MGELVGIQRDEVTNNFSIRGIVNDMQEYICECPQTSRKQENFLNCLKLVLFAY